MRAVGTFVSRCIKEAKAMGLDSYVVYDSTATKDSEGKIQLSGEHDPIAYWHKCWFIHIYMAEYYQEHYDEDEYVFNCVPMQLNQEMLETLKQEMSKKHLLDSLSGHSNISDYEIEELQKVISYIKSNPDTPLYFYSWY